MILLQAGMGYAFIGLVILAFLALVFFIIVFFRSDEQIIDLIKRGVRPTLKQKAIIVFKNFLYSMTFVLIVLSLLYWAVKDFEIM
jgi:hypothetical protein